ncbi:MAG: biopolymer transporter ExbD [Phycisphaerales bacterium]|nr:biopolymer transporter ExbD [Phycisphaerales bacterium]
MSRHVLRRRNALATHELHYGPNMTPMVDVVMVILVFFMASASVLGPEWLLKTALPPSKPSPIAPSPDITRVELQLAMNAGVVVARVREGTNAAPALDAAGIDDVIRYLNDTAKRLNPKQLAVVVRPRGEVPYETVVQLHELCARLGIEKIGILDPAKP